MNSIEREKLLSVRREMKQRCYNPNHSTYKNYGGRGIKIYDEWLNDYNSFLKWAENNGYREGLSIDRIDNDGPYSPENCQFTDRITQANNKRNNHLVTYQGKTQSLADWARELNLEYNIIQDRIVNNNWGPERAFTEPVPEKKIVTYNGETKTLGEFIRDFGLWKSTVYYRYEKGLPLDVCFRKEPISKREMEELTNPEKANSKKLEYKGNLYYVEELAEMADLTVTGFLYRINDLGMSVEDAVEKKIRKIKYALNGESHTLQEWCNITGVNENVAKSRIDSGIPLELAIRNDLQSPDGSKMKEALEKYKKEHPEYIRIDKRAERKERREAKKRELLK